jgi:hypothetical protein
MVAKSITSMIPLSCGSSASLGTTWYNTHCDSFLSYPSGVHNAWRPASHGHSMAQSNSYLLNWYNFSCCLFVSREEKWVTKIVMCKYYRFTDFHSSYDCGLYLVAPCRVLGGRMLTSTTESKEYDKSLYRQISRNSAFPICFVIFVIIVIIWGKTVTDFILKISE